MYYPKVPCTACGGRTYRLTAMGLEGEEHYYQDRQCIKCERVERVQLPLILPEDGLYTFIQPLKRGPSMALHRLVMEWITGKPLQAGTIVHHINGHRRDNRPDNLVALAPSAHKHPHSTVDALRHKVATLEQSTSEAINNTQQSEIVCPFCTATCPLTGDEARPIPFEGYGDFEAYRCACGAIGSPSGDIGEAGWPLEEVEAALAAILEIPRGHMEVTVNHVTHTDPPMLMLWGRRRETS